MERVNATSKTLETVNLGLSIEVESMTFLLSFVGDIRNEFSELELEATSFFCEGGDVSKTLNKTALQRTQKRKSSFD